MKKVELTQFLFIKLIAVTRCYKLRHKLTSRITQNSMISKSIFLQDFYVVRLTEGVMLDVIAGIKCIFEGVENIILHSDFVCKCISEGM